MLLQLVESSRQRQRPAEDEAFWKILCFVEDRTGSDCSPCKGVEMLAATESRVQRTQQYAPCTPDTLQTFCPGTPVRAHAEGLPKRRRLSMKSPDPHHRISMGHQSFCPGTPDQAYAESLPKQWKSQDSAGRQNFCPRTPVRAFEEDPPRRRRLSMKSPDPERHRVPQTPDRVFISAPGTPDSVFAPFTPTAAHSPVRRRLRSKSPAHKYRTDMYEQDHDPSKASCVSSLLERLASKTSACAANVAPKTLGLSEVSHSQCVPWRSPHKPTKRSVSRRSQGREPAAAATLVAALCTPRHVEETQQGRIPKYCPGRHAGIAHQSTCREGANVAGESGVRKSSAACEANRQLEAARESGRKAQQASGSGLQLPPARKRRHSARD
eukprot:TRINITY_DN60978_c0_g1_i1.p1 TRINITY_DN60978_c0_g1~~TRINITY_DN60978_c0_g1_i1.p1  ORF type:complete len:381 (+),score=45.58 TRINITY_DN60978_c0_g1_i1:31-1173(+)